MLVPICLAISFLASRASALPQGCKPPAGAGRSTAKALYLTSNEAAGNQIIAIPIGADGKLSGGAAVGTGGTGGNGIDGSTNQTAFPDPLFSQSALTVVGSNIFAINAADNTASMLAIDPRDPTRLTPVGAPQTVDGDFPVTVAASGKHSLVCVGTSGVRAGVSCAPFSTAGIGAFDASRPFELGQSNPPVGPTNTVSQVFFSDDEAALFATVKGDGVAGSDKPGAFAVFPVEADCAGPNQRGGQQKGKGKGNGKNGNGKAAVQQAAVAAQGVLTAPAGSAVLFGSAPIPGSAKVFVTDASFGAGIVSLDDETDAATLEARTPIDGQKATCWTAISPATGTAFVTDVAVNRLVEMSTSDASIVAEYDLSANGDPGLIDLKAGGEFVYALSPGNGTTEAAITVMDVSAGPGQAVMVQHFALTGLGAGKNSQGLALLL